MVQAVFTLFNKRFYIQILTKKAFCFLSCFAISIAAIAQKKDTTKAAIIHNGLTANDLIRQEFDSTQKQFFIAGDATSLLEANSNAYVKNYGLSNLSTLSIRGSSVAQTSVLWNDIPIQNTMLGLTDLSTVPNFFFDEMAVFPSGFGQKGKVQTIGGRLELNNQHQFTNDQVYSASALYGYESFENHLFGAKLKRSSKKLNVQLKYYNRQGRNRYEFNNLYTKANDTIEHAYAIQEQLMADVSYKPNQQHVVSLHFWKIRNFREITPLAFENNLDRSEQNKITRFGLKHKYYKKRISWNSTLGFTTDSFNYQDRHVALSSIANVKNIPLNTSLSYYINEQSDIGVAYNQQFGFYYQKDKAESLKQFGGQLFYNHTNLWQGIALHAFLQKQFASIGENPFTYGAKFSRKIGKRHLVYLSYNTNYRLPTLNELYYFPGGNENLKPEKSKNIELGGRVAFSKGKYRIENTAAFYSRNVDDWIVWTGAAIFFPDNIAKVWSRGLENTITATYSHEKLAFRNTFLFSYNLSTGQKAHFVNDKTVGKQIPYVPRLSWRNNLYAQYSRLNAQLNLSYTGHRFITRDETEYVNPYTLLNFYLGYKVRFKKKQQIEFQFKLNNLLNEDYESVRGRIMPLRNYAFSAILNLTS